MSQLINFEKYNYKERGIDSPPLQDEAQVLAGSYYFDHSTLLKMTIDLLNRKFPDKMLFNQDEAARILGMSYEFINRKCKDGIINTSAFGSKQLISIIELARIINNGVPNVD